MDLKSLGELEFVRLLKKSFNNRSDPRIIKAIGDDTSVTAQDADTYLLTTTDSLVQGVHFSLDYFEPFCLGKKALQVSLSDIAAMGGIARFYLVSLTLPKSLPVGFIKELYNGFKASGKEYSVDLVGGNTTGAPDGSAVVITTTVLGEVPVGEVVLRETAKEGDRIYVTGMLGDSALGRKLLNGELKGGGEGAGAAVKRHFDPIVRLKAGRLLASQGLAGAMIDISDGLLMDLSRLCEESSVGAGIFFERLPVSSELKNAWEEFEDAREDLEGLPLCGGEDYELLFTVAPEKVRDLNAVKGALGVSITDIGVITDEDGKVAVLGPDNKPMKIDFKGFEHFRE
ncbi:MAG: thiamine-phosphate kinase [Thermodesulfobacteriota bacterium]